MVFTKGYPQAPVGGTGTPTLSLPLRTNMDALWVNNYTEDEAFPANPDPGTSRVNASDPNNIRLQFYVQGAWHTVIPNLEDSAYPTVKRASFMVASATWTIIHNIGDIVMVQCYDNSNPRQAIIPASITQVLSGSPSLYNTVTITHAAPETGHVVLVG